MSKTEVPDAWDDDWVNIADKADAAIIKPESPAKLTKAEKRAQHAELQRQLWDTAENPARNLWLEAQGAVPLQQAPKPQVTLLSRKPPIIAKKDVADRLGNLNIDDGDDSEEEARKKREADFEERQRKAKIEREEKQRRYAEARERIMGPGNTSPASTSRESSHSRDNRRQRPAKVTGARRSQPHTPGDRSPSGQASRENGLFEAEDMSRRLATKPGTQTPREDQPVRQPRGPDNSGRGGFGFASRYG